MAPLLTSASLSSLVPALCLLIGLAVGLLIAGRLHSRRLIALEAQLEAERRAAEATVQQARAELSTSSQVRELVAPVADALHQLEGRVSAADRAQAQAKAELSEQVRLMTNTLSQSAEQLRRETGLLKTALGKSEVRGAWGEMQLRRLVEASGLLERVNFDTQVSVVGEDGVLRPDMIIRLADDKDVVVDSKVSLRSFLDAEAADSDEQRRAAIDAHVDELTSHVTRLSSKQYWRQFENAPEFVIMFVPAEGLLVEAMYRDPGLLEDALSRNVLIATPTVMLAIMRTIAHMWRQEAVAKEAKAIHALGLELHGRISTMAGHFAAVGSSLEKSVDSYNKAIASLESRVLVTTRRFEELEVTSAHIAPKAQVESRPRQLQAPELVSPEQDRLPGGVL